MATKEKQMQTLSQWKWEAPKPSQQRTLHADPNLNEAYFDVMLLAHDMMLPLYEADEHPRFTLHEIGVRLEDALDLLQSSRPLLNNAQKNLNAARAIVQLEEPDARAAAAANFAQQIVHVYSALAQPEDEIG
ncbi:MAG: hypothetical protein CUN53_14445 [Phototrophicales bacterium]|nr:MAG: hypothetical protein CUN53_14445 [Phototrophicales bacterium]